MGFRYIIRTNYESSMIIDKILWEFKMSDVFWNTKDKLDIACHHLTKWFNCEYLKETTDKFFIEEEYKDKPEYYNQINFIIEARCFECDGQYDNTLLLWIKLPKLYNPEEARKLLRSFEDNWWFDFDFEHPSKNGFEIIILLDHS